ncbi:MAG: hypothetical protein AB1726_13025 [Planctomycetota bacterium]
MLAEIALSMLGQADMLDNAKEFLATCGHPVPPGYAVEWGTKTSNDAAGETIPDDPDHPDQGGTIVINPVGIQKLSPHLTGDVTQYGGILVTILYHEYQHANGNHAGGSCDEIRLQKDTAHAQCVFICYILNVLPGANVTPICTMYNDVRDSYNDGRYTEGGASTVWEQAGCTGDYPGDIPECECCPAGGQGD